MKKSSYQKLKDKITALESDMHTLITAEDEFKTLEIRNRYLLKYGLEETSMFGKSPLHGIFEISKSMKFGGGLVNFIDTPNDDMNDRIIKSGAIIIEDIEGGPLKITKLKKTKL